MKHSISIILILILFMQMRITTFASDEEWNLFSNPIVGEDGIAILEEEVLDVVDPGNMQDPIRCFAVSEDGRVAIGTQNASNAKVLILDVDGNILSAYAFDCGSEFGVLFLNNDLAIYYNRSKRIVLYDAEGNAKAAYAIPSSAECAELAIHIMEATQIERNGIMYRLERDIKFDDREYCRLIKYDDTQQRTVLYDVTPFHNLRVVVCYTGLGLFVLLWIGFAVQKVKHDRTVQ